MEFQIQRHQRRVALGLSQDDLAEQLFIFRQAVSKWETGAATPDLTTLVKLAQVLEVSLDQLVLGTAPQTTAPTARPVRHMNFWEFTSRYWWLYFAFGSMLVWAIGQIIGFLR